MKTKRNGKPVTLDMQLDLILLKYPLPCHEECGLTEPCVGYKHCKKWIAVDFCRARDRLLLKRKLRQVEREEYATMKRNLGLSVEAWRWG